MERLLLRGFLHHYRDRLWCVIIASLLLNVLVFAGSAYSMIVYDSIIPSGSISTLVALFGILVVVYLFQYTFETLRSEAMLGVANGIHRDLSGRIQHAVVTRALKAGGAPGDGLQPIRDLDQIYSFLSSSGPIALIDPFFLYLGYIGLASAERERGGEGRIAALYGLVGAINLPIIHYSVLWWRTLHQGESIGITGSSIDNSILWPLPLTMVGFTCLFGAATLMRMRAELAEAKVEARMRRLSR